MTTKTKKKSKNVANPQRKRDGSATDLQRIRYASAPLLQQFRAHTRKNEARLWIPIETSLLSRYEFAALSPQTRYIFVAILLYCAGNGIDEIPLDTKFMSSALIVDERTLRKSLDELLFQKLLQERIERQKEKKDTDRQESAGARVSVNGGNLSKTESEEEVFKTENRNGHLSQFSLEECKRYVEKEISEGATINNANALAMKLFKTGEADSIIKARLYPEQYHRETFGEPRRFTVEPCTVCFGAKMSDADGKGYTHCAHCKNEKGISTGLEPEGASEQ